MKRLVPSSPWLRRGIGLALLVAAFYAYNGFGHWKGINGYREKPQGCVSPMVRNDDGARQWWCKGGANPNFSNGDASGNYYVRTCHFVRSGSPDDDHLDIYKCREESG